MSHYRRAIPLLLLAALLVWGVATLWMRDRWPRGVLEVGLFALAAGILLKGDVQWNWRLGALALVAVWPVLQLLFGWTVYRHATLEAALFWAAALSAYTAASHLFQDNGGAERFRRGMIWFGMGLAAVAVLQLHTSEGRVYWLFDSGYRNSVLGPFVYRNNYAAFIELLLPLALVEAFGNRGRNVWFQTGSALMFASVIASGSRAGAVLVSVEVVVIGALSGYRRLDVRRSALASIRIILLIAALTAVAGWGVLWDRFQDEDPLGLRRRYLEASLDMARERPWTGFGLGAWPHVYPAYARFDDGMFANRAHDDWAEWAVEGGVFFVAVLGLLAAGSLRRAWASGWGVGLVSVCVHALIDYPFARLGQAVWWFALAAMLHSTRQVQDAPQ